MVKRDDYQLLGVPLDASAGDICSAYGKPIKVIHSDRCDPVRQAEQWQAAGATRCFPGNQRPLGKRPAPDANSKRAGKRLDDGSARHGAVALEPNCFYAKGW